MGVQAIGAITDHHQAIAALAAILEEARKDILVLAADHAISKSEVRDLIINIDNQRGVMISDVERELDEFVYRPFLAAFVGC